MSEHPEHAKYSAHVGEAFRLARDGEFVFETTLAEITHAGPRTIEDAAAAGRPPPFSMIFRGPAEPILPQAIYRLSHPALGETDLFLVPIGPHDDGIGYEAVFS